MAFEWERIESEIPAEKGGKGYATPVFRAKVPGGWFVYIQGQPPFFYPDEKHGWDGNTVK